MVAAAASVACVIGLAACGGSDATQTASSSSASGPVEIEVWGWDKNAPKGWVAKYNESQNEVKVNYVLQASNTATQQNFRNAFEAKTKLPDLVQGFAPLTTNVSNGWAEDITDAIQPLLPKFTEGARENAQIDGKYYGLPGAADGTFGLVNTDVLAKYGVEAPKTWDDVIALGEKMKADGGKVFNLAGEDPSGFMQMAQKAGANWFKIDGDSWVVNMQDDATNKAVDIIQKLIDEDLVSNQTYKDKPALYNFFDSGKLGVITLAYWSSTGYKTNMPNTSGKWQAIDYPSISSADEGKVPGYLGASSFIPKGTDRAHQDAVIKMTNWQNTPEGYEAGRDPDTGTLGVPAGRTEAAGLDVEKYAKEAIPDNFYSNNDEAQKVIVNAATNGMGGFDLGPNYDAWFPELQDQWGKAVAKQITLKDAMKNVQDFVVQDLQTKGINVKVG